MTGQTITPNQETTAPEKDGVDPASDHHTVQVKTESPVCADCDTRLVMGESIKDGACLLQDWTCPGWCRGPDVPGMFYKLIQSQQTET